MTNYKWLPDEPTNEMLYAMQGVFQLSLSRYYDIYKAVLNAAPEVEPLQTLEELEQEIYENTQAFIPHNVMKWMLKRYRNHTPETNYEQPTEAPYSDSETDAEWVSQIEKTPDIN